MTNKRNKKIALTELKKKVQFAEIWYRQTLERMGSVVEASFEIAKLPTGPSFGFDPEIILLTEERREIVFENDCAYLLYYAVFKPSGPSGPKIHTLIRKAQPEIVGWAHFKPALSDSHPHKKGYQLSFSLGNSFGYPNSDCKPKFVQTRLDFKNSELSYSRPFKLKTQEK
jgi:hypothetical protein